ncbi:MAG: undecaprenyl-diphosphatase [Bradymonadia bacterium]|jgi:undecaprenyl-diphosphatase
MFESALLGLIQALTEFLPVSSSGHLRLGHAWLGFDVPDDLLFDIVLHLGTLVAVLIVYRKRVGKLIADIGRGLKDLSGGVGAAMAKHEGLRYFALLIIATLPTGVLGILLKDIVGGEAFTVPLVGGMLLINGGILFVSRFFQGERTDEDERTFSVGGIGVKEALIIGIAQGLAVCPGISRSGSTIVTALALGANRMKAAEFSFFLSIPAILGAVVLEIDPAAMQAGPGGMMPYIVGATVSAGAGVLALVALLGVVKAAKLHRFAFYCWALGIAAIVWGLR